MPREQMTLRRYLTIRALEGGTHPLLAMEAVASTALAHPELDMDEEKTWEEWNGATDT